MKQTLKSIQWRTFFAGVIVGLMIALPSVLGVISENQRLNFRLSVCEEEATAWFNATVTQGDAFYKYFLYDKNPLALDYTISQNFATKGHELDCISNDPPRAE